MKKDRRLCIRLSEDDLAALRALRGQPGFEEAPLAMIMRVLVHREAQTVKQGAGVVLEQEGA
jgi:predicted DNA binding CopG/RHH family protein